MNTSLYFDDLSKAYRAEIEDLRWDSEGQDVLAHRLAQKRAQFAGLMPMIDCAPEMVVPVFHGAVTFIDPHALVLLSFSEPDTFPAWDALASAVSFDSWAQKLVATALLEPEGERFLLTVICLEFLYAQSTTHSSLPDSEANDADADDSQHDDADEPAEMDRDAQDLEQAGSEWLAEQGFDRRD